MRIVTKQIGWLVVCLALWASSVIARPASPDEDHRINLPQNSIARINQLEGEASIQHAGGDDWDAAAINVPVVAGDQIYTGDNARLELQLHGGAVRLSEHTAIDLIELSAGHYRFDLTAGAASFAVFDPLNEFEIATPQSTITTKIVGLYRINVQTNGDVEVIVHRGEAEVVGQSGNFRLREGRRASFSADNPLDVEIATNIFLDGFDSWNTERDNLLQVNGSSYGYVGQNIYGVNDLDNYGSWVNVNGFGWAWQPAGVGIGWAPYRFGHWGYYQPWGWTWISTEPWGWLPYHFGHWTYTAAYGWVWLPSDLDDFWSPALVTWYTIPWNNYTYICWHPTYYYWTPQTGNPPDPAPTPAPKPLTSIPPGQPLKHHDGVNGQPVLGKGERERVDLPGLLGESNGLSMIGAEELRHGGRPLISTPDVLQRLNTVKAIEPARIERPTHPGLLVYSQAARPLPAPEIVNRTVFGHSVKSEHLQTRRQYQVNVATQPGGVNTRTTNSGAQTFVGNGAPTNTAKPVQAQRPVGALQSGPTGPTNSPAHINTHGDGQPSNHRNENHHSENHSSDSQPRPTSPPSSPAPSAPSGSVGGSTGGGNHSGNSGDHTPHNSKN